MAAVGAAVAEAVSKSGGRVTLFRAAHSVGDRPCEVINELDMISCYVWLGEIGDIWEERV